ncbi:MAG: ribosomal protein S18-alanine N-acetyltransferase [Vicinamibacterales bacterium]
MRIERLVADDVNNVSFASDVDAVVGLESASFTNPWPRETLVWELQNSDVTRVYLLRTDEGPVAAFCSCWIVFDELHINTVAVAPAERRKGLATALLMRVIEEAAAAGAIRATLEVRASNAAALATYARLGFRVAAVRPGYYVKPDEDALILWRERLDRPSGNP